MRSVALAGLVFAIGGAAALACSSFGADGGGTPSATDAAAAGDADATTIDDAATTDAADGGPPTTNLLVNGDFESGCNSWDPYPSQASLSAVASGRDGGTACRVCTTQASTILLSLNQTPVHAPPPSSNYGAEVWVRGVAGAGATVSTVGQTAYATLRARDDAGLPAAYAQNGLPLVADWQTVRVKVGVGQVANTVDFYVYVDRDGGFPPQTCFDVDDATVFKIP